MNRRDHATVANVRLFPVPPRTTERERLRRWYRSLSADGRWGTPTAPTQLTPMPLRDLSRVTRIPQCALPPLLVESGWRPWRPIRGADTTLWQPPAWRAPVFEDGLRRWLRTQDDPSPEALYGLIQSEAAREAIEDAAGTVSTSP